MRETERETERDLERVREEIIKVKVLQTHPYKMPKAITARAKKVFPHSIFSRFQTFHRNGHGNNNKFYLNVKCIDLFNIQCHTVALTVHCAAWYGMAWQGKAADGIIHTPCIQLWVTGRRGCVRVNRFHVEQMRFDTFKCLEQFVPS